MKRTNNCLIYGWMSKGEGRRFYVKSSNPIEFTENQDEAMKTCYDIAKSIATKNRLYVASA